MDDKKRDLKSSPSAESDVEQNGQDKTAGTDSDRLKADYDKLKNDFLYLGAEFENYKKQAIKERSELHRYGAERFVRDLLEVVDNFERALAVQNTSENKDTLRDGVALIHRELQSLLSRHGVREIDPVGQPFDPGAHEALTSEETDQYPAGSISRVFKKAYRLHDRLLRPAQVVVAKAPSSTSQAEE
ncbi:MAG: nucleotide exchange factor GrpE [Bdellovibrionales bacterium]